MLDCVTYVTPVKMLHLPFYLTKSIIYATYIVTTVIRRTTIPSRTFTCSYRNARRKDCFIFLSCSCLLTFFPPYPLHLVLLRAGSLLFAKFNLNVRKIFARKFPYVFNPRDEQNAQHSLSSFVFIHERNNIHSSC